MGRIVACTVWIVGTTLGLSLVLLPRMGLLGAGVAWFAAQISVALTLFIWYVFKRHRTMAKAGGQAASPIEAGSASSSIKVGKNATLETLD